MNISIFKQYEPKTTHRFLVKFPEHFDIESGLIQKINKPKYINGKWSDIKIEFFDLIAPSISKKLFDLINFIKIKNNESKILFEFEILSLDPIGTVVEKWIVYVEDVLLIDFGDLDYSNENIQKPFMILKPFTCILNY